MTLLRVGILFAAAALIAAPASAQVSTGEVFGRTTDVTGGVLPGVTVTLAGPALIRPQSVTASATGGYRFPHIPIGVYSVTFELAGFKTLVRDGVVIDVGFTAEINVVLALSNVTQTVSVVARTPTLDTRSTQLGQNFVKLMLDRIPTARDPWAVIEQTPGVVMTLQNVGGSTSAQQPGFSAHDSNAQMWTIDGGTTTDVGSNSSTAYYDFDTFQEINVQTAGGDASNANPGITVNLITKNGGNSFAGGARLFVADQHFGALNIDDGLRRQGAGAGNPVQDVEEYGADAGGPILKDRAWFYVAGARSEIKVGVIGFYSRDSACTAVAASPIAFPLARVDDCLNADLTTLSNANLKLQWQEAARHKSTFGFSHGDRYRGSRGAGPFNPIETTLLQTAPTSITRFDHQWSVNDRFTLSGMVTHVKSGFRFDFQDPSLADAQAINNVDTGFQARSTTNSVAVRPSTQVKADGNYYAPGVLHGNHALKFGYSYRTATLEAINQVGGGATVRIRASGLNEADITRDLHTNIERWEESAYFTDSYKIARATINAGVRYDRYWDAALAASIPANRILPDLLPAVSFAGADTGARLSSLVPRIGVTYDLHGNGGTIAKASAARYVGVGVNAAEALQPTGLTNLRYFWTDRNGDLTVQREELDFVTGLIATPSANYNAANPSSVVSTVSVDPGLHPTVTDELILGIEHDFVAIAAVGGSYIHRHYHDNRNLYRVGAFTSEYAPATFTAVCGHAGTCDQNSYTGTYYQRATPLPSALILRNNGSYSVYDGVELTARRRFSGRWMMAASYTWDRGVFWEPQADRDYLDPTNVASINGASDGAVPWVVKVSGLYTLPWKIGVSAFANARSGFAYNTTILSPNRSGAGGAVDVLLQPNAALHYPAFRELDVSVDKTFRLAGRGTLVLQAAVFNVTNANTTLAIVTRQTSSTANNVTALLAPRLARFGVRVTF